MTYKIEEGDLLAYLNGDSDPQLEMALQESAELLAELEALQQVDAHLRHALNNVHIFNEQDVVDVVTGQATANQRLIVAAQRRRDPVLDAEMQAMEAEYAQLTAPKPSRWQLPQFIAQPIAAAMGVRSNTYETQEHAYHVVELQAQVTVRIVPPDGEIWALEGYVAQNHQPASQVQVDLATDDFVDPAVESLATLQSDEQGFFVFQDLDEGTYYLRITLADGSILVRDLTLLDEDENKENETINLPADPLIVRDLFFNDFRVAILEALQQGDQEQAQRFITFAQTIANQTDEPEHHALSAWCSGVLHFNRNISEAANNLDRTRQYYAETNQPIIEGRVLVGYASQLSQIGRLDEAEQSILRARKFLWDADYRDWPLLYLNLACVQFYQARYEHMLASAQQSEALALECITLYADKTDYYTHWLAQAIINQSLAALFLGQMEDSERRLHEALTLTASYQWDEINGRARLCLARLYTFQGKLFAALETLKQAEKDFSVVQIDIEQATVLLYQADIYQRLMLPIQARSASVQAAKILFHSNVVAEGIEAYLLATHVSLNRREAKRARRYLEASEPFMAQASPFLQAIRQSYASHKILNPNKSLAVEALKQADQAYKQLHDLGAVAQMLTAALIAADLATLLEQPDVACRYNMIIEQCQAHNLIDLEQQARMQLGTYHINSLSYVQAQSHLRRAAEILAFKREQMPVEELKATLIGGSTKVYTQLIEVSLLNKDINGATETLIEAKGGIWLDLLSPAEILAQKQRI